MPADLPIPRKAALARQVRAVLAQSPATLARLVGAPMIHASHAGHFDGRIPWLPGLPYRSRFQGETQIVDASGAVLGRMPAEHGNGVVCAAVEVGRRPAVDPIPDGFWLHRFRPLIRCMWHLQNAHGRRYYRRNAGPRRMRGAMRSR